MSLPPRTEAIRVHAIFFGPGVGGHYIPIDPFYLAWKAGRWDRKRALWNWQERSTGPCRNGSSRGRRRRWHPKRKKLRGARVLVLGIAYKANVEDDRESPSYRLLSICSPPAAQVAYYDPHVPVIRPTREHSHWAGTKSVKWNRRVISSFDLVLISTAHDAVNYQQLADWAALIVDTRNTMAKYQTAEPFGRRERIFTAPFHNVGSFA